MWWFGFVLHEISFGLLSVFIPLYIVAIGGSLIHVGVIASIALLTAIPASFLWGYLCDKSRRYKLYILLSFLSLALLIYIFAFMTDITSLIILYAFISFFHMAHEAPKNVLIAETYIWRRWEKAYAIYGGVTKVGWMAGILIGLYMSTCGFNSSSILIVCSSLNSIAFIASIFLLSDPIFIFERSLARIERDVLCICRGIAALKMMDSIYTDDSRRLLNLRAEKPEAFCCGLIAFFAATRALFTPLPIFLSRSLALKQSIVYALFSIDSLGGVIGYFLLNRLRLYSRGKALCGMAALRGFLSFLLIAVGYSLEYSVIFAAILLFLLGLSYAVFHVLSLSLSMEILPERMAGIFNVITGLGEALGSFIGTYIAERLGFTCLFLGAGLIFFFAYVIFKTAA